jgi:chromosome segregation ATPase
MADRFPTDNDITPEKLTVMKLKASGLGRDIMSEPSSPTGNRSFSFGTHAGGHSSTLTTRRSTRQLNGSSRRTSSFLQSHRSKMSSELTTQADGKVFALMDLISNASREAASLKESWARILAERDALLRERDELMITVEEVTEEIQRKESEHSQYGHEHGERKKQVEKLVLELTAVVAQVSEHKKKLADRDRALELTRHELHELQASVAITVGEHERTRSELEATYARLKVCESERDVARHDSEKHHNEIRTLLREHTELKSKYSETISKFDLSRKELISINERIKLFELERDEHLHDKDRLHEELKRAKFRIDESTREFTELTENHDRVQRELHKLKETLRTIEAERDDFSFTIENLRREVKVKIAGWEEADARANEFSLKHEHMKREVVSVKDKLREVELERTEILSTIDRSREDHRLIVIEREQLKQDVHDERRKVEEGRRRINTLEESLRRSEHTITEIRSEILTLTERNRVLYREGEDSRVKQGHLTSEITSLQEQLTLLQTEITNIRYDRDRAQSDLNAWKHKYEEITETVTSYEDSSAEFEFEITSLRTLLSEAREQKERAIQARHAADRERDEYIAKYEEKCREMERFEENASSMYHAHSGGGGRMSTKTITHTRVGSGGTTIHNHDASTGHAHHAHHEHGEGNSLFG